MRFYTPESPGANVVNGGGFPSLLDTVAKFALLSVSGLKDEKLTKSKPT